MTPKAIVIQDTMNAVEKLEKAVIERLTKKVRKSFKTISDLYREIIVEDRDIFDRIFLSSYTKELRFKILADYVGIPTKNFRSSPKLDELEKLTMYMITCETLSEIFEVMSHSYSITPQEFIVSWYLMNESDELRNLFFSYNLDVDTLNENTKKYYVKEREALVAQAKFLEKKKEESNGQRSD